MTRHVTARPQHAVKVVGDLAPQIDLGLILEVRRMATRRLARLVGVGPATVASWLAGESRPSAISAVAVARAVHFPLDVVWTYRLIGELR